MRNTKGSTGSGGMLPRKNLKNLHVVLAILVLFEVFKKILFKFFDFDSSASPKDAFCSHIFHYACLRSKTYCRRRGSKL